MKFVVFEKFNQNKKLIKKLKNTKIKHLVEENYWHDNFWGNCLCPECNQIKGQNNLGKILIFVKEVICIST